MRAELEAILSDLESFGERSDSSQSDRGKKMLNITADTGEFLYVLLIGLRPKRILEVGTSNGYSTLWLAEAARTLDGLVTTIERCPEKFASASTNFAHAGLERFIEPVNCDASKYLAAHRNGRFDLTLSSFLHTTSSISPIVGIRRVNLMKIFGRKWSSRSLRFFISLDLGRGGSGIRKGSHRNSLLL